MANPYETAIHLTLSGNFAQGLADIIRFLGVANLRVAALEKGLLALRPAVLGAVSAFAGFEGFKFLKGAADHAKDLSHELSKIQLLGPNLKEGMPEFEAVKAKAMGLPSRVPGTTTAEGLSIFGQTYSILGTEHALKLMDALARFSQVTGAQTGDYKRGQDSIVKMVRAGELTGKLLDEKTRLVDPAKLEHFLDLGSKVLIATHGMVKPETWLALAQQGGPALSNMSDKGLFTQAIIAQAMGGHRAGTALTSAYQQMIGGKMTQYGAQGLQDLGLVGGYSVGQGGHIIWDKGALDRPFGQALQKDPLEASRLMYEAFKEHGFKNMEQIVPELFKDLGRQTTQRFMHELLRNAPQMAQERQRFEQGLSTPVATEIQNTKDYTVALHNLSQAWDDMMGKFGLGITEVAIPAMRSLGDAALSFGNFAMAHPDTIKNIGVAIAGLSTILIALGSAGVIAGAAMLAPGAAIAVGVAGLVLIFATIAKMDKTAQGWAMAIPKSLDNIFNSIGQTFVKNIATIPSTVAASISNMVTSIGKMLGDAFASIKNYLPSWLGGGAPKTAAPKSPYGDLYPPTAQHSSLVPQQKESPIIINNTLQLDGHAMASIVTRQMVSSATYPTSASGTDTQGQWVGPSSYATEL